MSLQIWNNIIGICVRLKFENVNYSSEINHAHAQTSNTSTRLWFYYIVTKIHPPFQNPGSAPGLMISSFTSYAWSFVIWLSSSAGKMKRIRRFCLFAFPRRKKFFMSINTEIFWWHIVSLFGQDCGWMLVSFHEPEPRLGPSFPVSRVLFDFVSDFLNKR